MTGKRSGVVAACAALVLALSACADGAAHPSPAPTTTSASPSPTSSATPTPSPPTLPAAAKVADATGASAFVKHYFSLVNYAYSSGDLKQLESLADNECNACSEMLSTISDARSAGTISHGEITVVDVAARPGDPSVGISAIVIIDQEPLTILSDSGATVKEEPALEDFAVRAVVRWTGNSWRMTEWGANDAPK